MNIAAKELANELLKPRQLIKQHLIKQLQKYTVFG
jgi:hypothetical protein